MVQIKAGYVEWIKVSRVSMSPEMAGKEWRFQFNGLEVGVRLPDIPPDGQNQWDDNAVAWVNVRRSSDKKPVQIKVLAIRLSLHALDVDVPAAIASTPHINMGLVNDVECAKLDQLANTYQAQAQMAMQHWLRVFRWQLNDPLVRINYERSRGTHGDRLINEATGASFWSSQVGRVVTSEGGSVIRQSSWEKIDQALRDGADAPVWEQYRASATRRVHESDSIAAVLDMAIAVESVVRTAIDKRMPIDTAVGIRKRIAKLGVQEIIADWNNLGLPSPSGVDLKNIRQLIEARNSIMHGGEPLGVTDRWCEDRLEDLASLIEVLH